MYSIFFFVAIGFSFTIPSIFSTHILKLIIAASHNNKPLYRLPQQSIRRLAFVPPYSVFCSISFRCGGLSIERNQKPLAPEITLAVTHHDRQKQVEVKRSSRVNPHEIRIFLVVHMRLSSKEQKFLQINKPYKVFKSVLNQFDPCRAYLLIFMDEDPLQESEIPVLYPQSGKAHTHHTLLAC